MASRLNPLPASCLQTATYLLGVCPFSIAFLVFLNSSISFVVTDLIGLNDGEGDAVGTLGFADELLALVACPIWGLLSDRIGVRYVCTIGYTIIALALFLFVQSSNVYPQLLLGRFLFSLGGSAVTTMVTATLPTITSGQKAIGDEPLSDDTRENAIPRSNHTWRASLSSELTITPARFERSRSHQQPSSISSDVSSKLAGLVGLCAGCGALLSLVAFLPLPARFERSGSSPAEAIQKSYYIVGGVALFVSIWCFIGLRNLPGEEEKGVTFLWTKPKTQPNSLGEEIPNYVPVHQPPQPFWRNLLGAFLLGFKHPDISLGYIGGFVARASSVGISLFIPLFVNRYYRDSHLCHQDKNTLLHRELGDIKRSCPEAYILASILTGVSQLVALIAAPFFGYFSGRSPRYQLPLLLAGIAGVVGYIAFPLLSSPQFKGVDGNPGVFFIMALVGLSQIGAIVCSLAVLSNGVLVVGNNLEVNSSRRGSETETPATNSFQGDGDNEENAPLLATSTVTSRDLRHLKGSIAGIYSLYGGAGILLLTKVGGLLFDTLSSGTPFFIMAFFNAILVIAGVGCGVWRYRLLKKKSS